jgi:hypothetical protein
MKGRLREPTLADPMFSLACHQARTENPSHHGSTVPEGFPKVAGLGRQDVLDIRRIVQQIDRLVEKSYGDKIAVIPHAFLQETERVLPEVCQVPRQPRAFRSGQGSRCWCASFQRLRSMTLEVSAVNTGVAGAAGSKPTLSCRPIQSRSPRRIRWTFGRVFDLLPIGEARRRLANN